MFDRITAEAGVLGGKPIVKGTRISVEFILELVASGGSIADIVRQYPFLMQEDVHQAVLFAARGLKFAITRMHEDGKTRESFPELLSAWDKEDAVDGDFEYVD
jgi:uncharacterized protein (DUF433 family)